MICALVMSAHSISVTSRRSGHYRLSLRGMPSRLGNVAPKFTPPTRLLFDYFLNTTLKSFLKIS